MTRTIKIELQSELPEGYHAEDYFCDRGACLAQRYASADEARDAIAEQYKGADDDGVGLDWVYVDTSDRSEVYPSRRP